MPKGKDYLAIPHYVLRDIADEWKQTGNLTLRIGYRLHLKFETVDTAECTCLSGKECVVTTTLVTEADGKLGNGKEIMDMLEKHPTGAVIIGS